MHLNNAFDVKTLLTNGLAIPIFSFFYLIFSYITWIEDLEVHDLPQKKVVEKEFFFFLGLDDNYFFFGVRWQL